MPIERFDPKPDKVSDIAAEHLARYNFAKNFAAGKKILDVACGTGYGSDILSAAGAKEVVGVDSCVEAIIDARKKYCRQNLSFIKGSAERLDFAADYFDIVTSFETIEHLTEPEAFLEEIKRVLKPGGILLISTPNRKLVSPYLFYRRPYNKFHKFEYTKKEFIKALRKYYVISDFLSQTGILSFLAPYAVRKILEKALKFFHFERLERKLYYKGDGPEVKRIGFLRTPTYFVAICRK